jgi:hypothetical protein
MPGRWLGVVRQSGGANIDWLIGMAEQLLVDAGLIGLPRGELRLMLERRAADAAAGMLHYRPFADETGAQAAFDGLSDDTSFYGMCWSPSPAELSQACQIVSPAAGGPPG